MKVLTIAGTRPELIRLSIIIDKLDKLVDHVFVYTNQNYTASLKDQFFNELGIREPDYTFKQTDSFSNFMANSFTEFESVLELETPDKVLILGDTNSGLLGILADRQGIPVYHMEAGNRCFDRRVPEETNRRIIDSLSTYNLPYTDNSKQNLLSEGYNKNYVFKTGNPIFEVLEKHYLKICASGVLQDLDLKDKEYVLVTMHRAENVDDLAALSSIMAALSQIAGDYKVVISVHPRTRNKMEKYNLTFLNKNVIMAEPFGFFDFVKLEKHAKLVISDSGTVQEECCIFGIPSLTIRNTTERQETVECGSNILVGTSYEAIITAYNATLSRDTEWAVPEGYTNQNVSNTVINILLGH